MAEISPARGDRPEPRHGAAIAPLNYATSFLFGTLLMSFGRDLVDHEVAPRERDGGRPAVPRDLVL